MAKTIKPDEYEHWGKFIKDEDDELTVGIDLNLTDTSQNYGTTNMYEGITTAAEPKFKDVKLYASEKGVGLLGWVCPVCGRGLSPYTSYCPCKGYVDPVTDGEENGNMLK